MPVPRLAFLLLACLAAAARADFGAYGGSSLGWLAEAEGWDDEDGSAGGADDAGGPTTTRTTPPTPNAGAQTGGVSPFATGGYRGPPALFSSAPASSPAASSPTSSTTSTFLDPGQFDFDVVFPHTTHDLGLTLGPGLRVAALADSLSAELTGLVAVGDTLIAINGAPVSAPAPSSAALAAVQAQLRDLQAQPRWFWLRFRPARLERRAPASLHDHNVTVDLADDAADEVRLGLVLGTGLAVVSVLPGPLLDDGGVKAGDVLVGVGGEIVTGRDLRYVADVLHSVVGSLRLRFRLPWGERAKLHGEERRRQQQQQQQQRQRQQQQQQQQQSEHKETGERGQQDGDGDGVEGGRRDGNTFRVGFDTLQDLGMDIADDLVVRGFVNGPHGGPGPAERGGVVRVGDVVLSVDGIAATSAAQVRPLLAQKTHEEVLRCRGGKVTRYCAIERVQPLTSTRVVVFRLGSQGRHGRTAQSIAAGRRRRQHQQQRVAAAGGTAGEDDDDDGHHHHHNDGLVAAIAAAAQDAPSARQLVGRTPDPMRPSSRYLQARQDALAASNAVSTVLSPAGRHESIFQASRGLAVGGNVSVDFSTALFGGALWCGAHRVVLASPEDACRALRQSERVLRNAYVVARRGGCFYSSKAINAQYAGAAGLIVIDHDHAPLPTGGRKLSAAAAAAARALPVRMPASDQDAHLVRIPAVMVSHAAGQSMLAALEQGATAGTPLSLSLTPENADDEGAPACPPTHLGLPRGGSRSTGSAALPSSTASASMSSSSGAPVSSLPQQPLLPGEDGSIGNGAHGGVSGDGNDAGGMLYLDVVPSAQGGHGDDNHDTGILSQIEFATAAFSGPFPSDGGKKLKLTVASPPDACAPLSGTAAGSILLVQRGGCALIDKTMAAERAGASAVVVVNSKACVLERQESWGTMFRPERVKPLHNVTIPSVMVGKHAGQRLVQAVEAAEDAGAEALQARLEANSSHIHLWKSLAEVVTPESGPASQSAREDLFRQLAREHHPGHRHGNLERYNCLVLAKSNVERFLAYQEAAAAATAAKQ